MSRPARARTPKATPGEVAEYLRKPVKTLAEWRSKGIGPPYKKVGRGVFYDWADVDEWWAGQPGGPSRDTRLEAS
jgi:hypothetical protein